MFFLKGVILFSVMLVFCIMSSYGSEKEVIKVGYEGGYGVVYDMDSIYKKGYGYEILKNMEQYCDYEFEFVEYENLEHAMQDVTLGNIDIVGLVYQSDFFENQLLFMENPLVRAQVALAEKNPNKTYYNDPISIDGATIGTFEENLANSLFDVYLEKNQISVEYQYNEYKNYIETEADYYLVSTLADRTVSLKSVLNLDAWNYYLAGNIDNADVIQHLDEAYEQFVIEDSVLVQEIYNKYYGGNQLLKRVLTREEAEAIEGQSFTVGYASAHQPIQFTNEEGNADGIAVDLLNKIADLANFELTYVEMVHNKDLENYEDLDLIINLLGESEILYEKYAATEPYLYLPLTMIINKELEEQKDKMYRIGMYPYNTFDEARLKADYPNSEIISADSILDGYTMLTSGEINSGLYTTTGLQYVQSVLDMSKYSIVESKYELPLVLYVNKDTCDGFLKTFNILFDQVESGLKDEVITRQTASLQSDVDAIKYIKDNLEIIFGVVVVLLVLISGIVIKIQHKNKVTVMKILNHDSMTNLISMYKFNQMVSERLENAKPNEYQIIVLDIDYFRIINNIYGYDLGSKIIVSMAKALEQAFQGKDVIISRYISETFVLFMKIEEVCLEQKMVDTLTQEIKSIIGEKYNLSLSVGVYHIEDCSEPINIMMDRANVARIKGKGSHETTCKNFDSDMKKIYDKKNEIVSHMKEAIEENEFFIVYQPKVNLKTLELAGAEALVRWRKKDGSLIFPNEFIPVFEANGFITKLDLFVLEEVCKYIKENEKLFSIPLISVNFSGMTMISEDIIEKVGDITRQYGVDPKYLEIEVTESVLVGDESIIVDRVQKLKALGHIVSMDDFGSGMSSLNRLNAMKVNVMKIDKAFLDYHAFEADGEIIIESIINMAKSLNIKVVTEGVETLEQVRLLQKFDCDLAQGYYFDRPLEEKQFTDNLKSKKSY